MPPLRVRSVVPGHIIIKQTMTNILQINSLLTGFLYMLVVCGDRGVVTMVRRGVLTVVRKGGWVTGSHHDGDSKVVVAVVILIVSIAKVSQDFNRFHHGINPCKTRGHYQDLPTTNTGSRQFH